jgi:hypothetical protein
VIAALIFLLPALAQARQAFAQTAPTVGQLLPDAPSSVSSNDDTTSDPQHMSASQPGTNAQAGNISGTITDVNGDLVPGATVALQSEDHTDRRGAIANDNGFFEFSGVKAGISYRLTVSAKGFQSWASSPLVVEPGQFLPITDAKLKLSNDVESVTVYGSNEQIAEQQVIVEEEQRVLGVIPNFYVVYDAEHAVPLTAKLKFKIALRLERDPIVITGAAFMAGIKQAADTPNYVQGMKGYSQRFGAEYTDGLTDIMFGGAILPALLHQDPRYFYQGTGSIKSRTLHALSNPFICRGDNGRLQPNYSSVGGDLISAAISNTYYPQSNRGMNFLFQNLLIDTAERTASSLLQEFVLRKFTPSAKRQTQ